MTDIEKNVMRRVHTIRVLRAFISLDTLVALVFAAALYGIGREVFVAKVFANGPQDLAGHLQYLSYAFVHTRVIVQALTLTALVSVVYLARETARLLTSVLVPRYA